VSFGCTAALIVFSNTNELFLKWCQGKESDIDNEREKQVQLTNNPKKNKM
jgi:hypothetical protein